MWIGNLDRIDIDRFIEDKNTVCAFSYEDIDEDMDDIDEIEDLYEEKGHEINYHLEENMDDLDE